MGEAIAITSGKGGVGKSSTIINIAMILAQMGNSVCLIDMDLGLKNLDLMMGLQHRVIFDLKDVLEGKCILHKAMIQDKHHPNISLLPACKSIHIDQFPKQRLPQIIEHLKEHYDYILLDTPAGIESGFVQSIECVEKCVIVTTLDVTALQDADRIIGILMRDGIEDISFVVNRYSPKLIEKGSSVSIEEAKGWLALPFLGYIFESEAIIHANNHGIPLSKKNHPDLYACYLCICKRLLGEHVPLPKIKNKSIFSKLFKA